MFLYTYIYIFTPNSILVQVPYSCVKLDILEGERRLTGAYCSIKFEESIHSHPSCHGKHSLVIYLGMGIDTRPAKSPTLKPLEMVKLLFESRIKGTHGAEPELYFTSTRLPGI